MAAKSVKREWSKAVANSIAGAPPSSLPLKLSPQLATLAGSLPAVGRWLFEVKFDGYRIVARVEGGKAQLITRNGNDWTSKMPSLALEVAKLPVKSAWLDGEAVVLDAKGVPHFNRLQNAFDARGTEEIVFFVFDVPFLDGRDLRSLPQQERSEILAQLIPGDATSRVRLSKTFEGDADAVLRSACAMGLEGIMAKRADAPYVLKRSTSWLKLKCHQRQEFVVGGFTARSDNSRAVGSLLLGVYAEGKLLPAGSVGTGWDTTTAASLMKSLVELEVEKCPFSVAPSPGRWSRRVASAERWVKPKLVVEVQFAEWTLDGAVRHASFQGLRLDKPAKSIRREVAK